MRGGTRKNEFLRNQASAMGRRRIAAAAALVVLLLLSLVGTTPFEVVAVSDGDSPGDLLRQVLFLGIFALVLLVQTEAGDARPPMAVPFSIVLLLGYCLLSVAWAIEPVIALRRLILTGVVIWTIVRAIGDLGAVRTFDLLRWVMAGLVLASYLVVAFTDLGIHGDSFDETAAVAGDWRGILPHKNTAGMVCAVTILLFAFDRKRIPAWLSVAVILAALPFLIMANSKTALVMLVLSAGAGVGMLFYDPRHRSLLWPIGLVAGAALAGFLLAYSDLVLETLSDPDTLTGRGVIWELLLEYAGEHPWTGAGFGSFWQIGPTSPIFQLTSGWVAQFVGHGHNGYLDLLVTIGLPGMLLAVAVLIVWPAIRLLFSVSVSRARRALLVALLVFCVGHNMSESSILDRAAPVEVLLIIVIALAHRLSDQSIGRHHELRDRFLMLLGPGQAAARLRRRLRPPPPLAPARPPAGPDDEAGPLPAGREP